MDEASKKGTWSDWLAYIALRCVIAAVQALSLERCDRYCKILAILLANRLSIRKKTIDEGLRYAYGQLPEATLAILRERMWHNLLLMTCEIAHAPRKIHRTNWRDHFYMPHKREVVGAMLDDRPCVLVMGHYGNFEVAGHAVGLFGLPTATIARPLDNPYVDDYVHQFRSSTGQTILPKEGSAGAVADWLADNGNLAILADQHAGAKGCWVEFFGHPTSCHKALALFVLSSEAPMLVNYVRRLDRPMKFEMGITGIAEPNDAKLDRPPEHLQSVEALTKWYNEKLEEIICRAPEQYWWLHRRWRDVPAGVQKRLDKKRAAAEKKRAEKAA